MEPLINDTLNEGLPYNLVEPLINDTLNEGLPYNLVEPLINDTLNEGLPYNLVEPLTNDTLNEGLPYNYIPTLITHVFLWRGQPLQNKGLAIEAPLYTYHKHMHIIIRLLFLTCFKSSCRRRMSASVMSAQYGSTVAQKRSGASPLPLQLGTCSNLIYKLVWAYFDLYLLLCGSMTASVGCVLLFLVCRGGGVGSISVFCRL